MVKDPGFSTARAKPFKQGPLTTVASVMEARSLTSPALKARVTAEAAVALSASYFALKDAFISGAGLELRKECLCVEEP